MRKLLLIPLVCLMGCSSLKGTATIKQTTAGVKFETSRPAIMSMEKDGATYKYNSQSESILGKIVSVLSLGIVGAK